MVIFGGLEFIVGGYFVYRHNKKKNHKKRLEAEAEQRRNNTFPGANPQRSPHEPLPQYQQRPPPLPHRIPRRPVPQRYQHQPRPHTAQTFPIYAPPEAPRPTPAPTRQQLRQPQNRPAHIPQHMEIEIRPLQRSDSFTTLSDMPIANGHQYTPPASLRPQVSGLQVPSSPNVASGPYSNAGFSVSVPLFDRPPSSPMGSPPRVGGTVDDNWETYSPHSPQAHMRGGGNNGDADENDPPPPYVP